MASGERPLAGGIEAATTLRDCDQATGAACDAKLLVLVQQLESHAPWPRRAAQCAAELHDARVRHAGRRPARGAARGAAQPGHVTHAAHVAQACRLLLRFGLGLGFGLRFGLALALALALALGLGLANPYPNPNPYPNQALEAGV